MTVYGAPKTGAATARRSHNRQVVGAIGALLAFNGLLCWVNTFQHSSLPTFTYLGCYALLAAWFGAAATAHEEGHLARSIVFGVATLATQVHVFIIRPETLAFRVGWFYQLGTLAAIAVFLMFIREEIVARRQSQPEEVEALATVVPLPGPRETSPAIDRAA